MLLETEFKALVAKEKADPSVELAAEEVRKKFGPMFSPEGIGVLDPENFKKFLRPSENRHWSGLSRQGAKLTEDLPRLRQALSVLLDEEGEKPIPDRIDEARTIVDGLGRAIFSAILQVAHPQKYGVYNSTSGEGLTKIGMHPRDDPNVKGFDSKSWGKKYQLVNNVLNRLSTEYEISLWALDRVWWGLPGMPEAGYLGPGPSPPSRSEEAVDDIGALTGLPGRFALESHLEDFLEENWDKTPLAASLEILADDDGQAIGRQYRTSVGPIDFLCRNKGKPGYTVIELKRQRSSDAAVGQIQRYMTAVRLEVAKGAPVSGIIICGQVDDKLRYAVAATQDISVHTYEVSFALKADPGLPPRET